MTQEWYYYLTNLISHADKELEPVVFEGYRDQLATAPVYDSVCSIEETYMSCYLKLIYICRNIGFV